MNQILHCLTVTGVDELNRTLRHTGSCRCLTQNPGHRLIGLHGLAATLEHHGVAGFQAQARRVSGHIGARFVDDADNPQGHAHFCNL